MAPARLLVRAYHRSSRFVIAEVRNGLLGAGDLLVVDRSRGSRSWSEPLTVLADLTVTGSYLRSVRRLALLARPVCELYLDDSIYGRGYVWTLARFPRVNLKVFDRLLS